jgi:nicotinamide phosphoribosyltransferase
VVELLWDVFGGTVTEKGYKLLDSHIGVIYGDSITTERATDICQRLKDKGFASQTVFGIGSYTYQYNTRDTFGIAMKATYIELGDEPREIFKNPVTDDGTKISATGLLCVTKENGGYKLTDKCKWGAEIESELKTVFKNGKLTKDLTLQEIRNNLNG